MALEDIVQVSITTTTAQVARQSFGIPMIIAYHTKYADRVRTYSASTMLSQLVTEGFATTDVVYLSAQALLAANPRPRTIKVGRRNSAAQQVTRLVPSVANSTVYSLKVNGATATYTSDSSATDAEIATGLAAAIDALSLVTASGVSGTHVDMTVTAAGTKASITDMSSNLALSDQSVDAGIAADLALIQAADPDWYAGVIDSNASAEILLAADWFETQKKILGVTLSDSGVIDVSDTTGIGSDLEAAGYERTFSIFNADPSARTADRWIGEVLTTDPGSATWKFKTLSGQTVSSLVPGQQSAATGKNVNIYVPIGGRNITLEGVMASGEFIDIVIFVDWVVARVQERVFALLANSAKMPYSNRSVEIIKGEIYAVLQEGISVGGLLEDPAPVVTAPRVEDVDPVDRAARLLPDVQFSANLAGAIHAVQIQGTLSV